MGQPSLAPFLFLTLPQKAALWISLRSVLAQLASYAQVRGASGACPHLRYSRRLRPSPCFGAAQVLDLSNKNRLAHRPGRPLLLRLFFIRTTKNNPWQTAAPHKTPFSAPE